MISFSQINISTCMTILLISFLGIHLISKDAMDYWHMLYNEKSTIFHEKMLRGLGVIYPVAIIPIFFLIKILLKLLII